MSEELRRRLASTPVPDAADAAARARATILAAGPDREGGAADARSTRVGLRRRPVVVAAVLGAALAAAGPPGAAVGEWVQRQLAPPPAPEPEIVPARRLPGEGRLLMHDARGLQVIGPRGERARLGRHDGAAWSPHGLFVVAWRGNRLSALSPDGATRWSLTAPARIRAARWSPDGFRIAFLTTDGVLRVVAGDGSGARPLASARRAVPAWRPGRPHTVAYVGPERRLLVRDVDGGAPRDLARAPEGTFALSWSGRGRRLAAIAPKRIRVVRMADPRDVATLLRPPGGRFTAAAYAPAPGRTRLARVTRRHGRSTFMVGGRMLSIRSRIPALAWSPDGSWLMLDARDAGRLLAVRGAGPLRVLSRPGGRLEGWSP